MAVSDSISTSSAAPPDHAPPPATADSGRSGRSTSLGGRHVLILGVALVLQLFSVGGRWDVPLAAWLLVVFLLRWSRTSRPIAGLLSVWAVQTVGGLFWLVELAVPVTLLAGIGIVGLSLAATLPYAADRYVTGRRGHWTRLLAFPTVLVATQFLVATLNPFGTAYGLLAVTQRGNTALLQVLSLIGPYAFAALLGLVATSANLAWERGWSRAVLRRAVLGPVVVVVALVGGQAALGFFPAPSTPSVRVAGVNPDSALATATDRALGVSAKDYPAVARLDPAVIDSATTVLNNRLLDDTRRAARGGARVVMWTENAAKIRAGNEQSFLAVAGAVAQQEQIYLSVAANVYLPDAPFARDESVLLGPDGRVLWTYQKQHPIPGLENYVAGSAPAPVVDTPYGRLSTIICYDADFPATAAVDTDILLVPGGDWPQMGRTHTEMASLRAIENGYSLVRADFNGYSAAYNARGESVSSQDSTRLTDTLWYADVPTRSQSTVYHHTGDVLGWLAVLGTIAWLAMAIARPRRDGKRACGERSTGHQRRSPRERA